jgi:hypothetical protein
MTLPSGDSKEISGAIMPILGLSAPCWAWAACWRSITSEAVMTKSTTADKITLRILNIYEAKRRDSKNRTFDG